jgi:hypothetical protein
MNIIQQSDFQMLLNQVIQIIPFKAMNFQKFEKEGEIVRGNTVIKKETVFLLIFIGEIL